MPAPQMYLSYVCRRLLASMLYRGHAVVGNARRVCHLSSIGPGEIIKREGEIGRAS